jgi:hypothetical protein
MGGGSGNPGPFKIGGISGQGGGRVIPGTAGGVGELFTTTNRTQVTANTAYPDLRPAKPFGSRFDTAFAAPGGGPGQAGRSDVFSVYRDTVANLITPFAGGGGGWGAAGGAGLISTGNFEEPTSITSGNPGAAGGKAINTNGHAVTWLAGSARTYGAVG